MIIGAKNIVSGVWRDCSCFLSSHVVQRCTSVYQTERYNASKPLRNLCLDRVPQCPDILASSLTPYPIRVQMEGARASRQSCMQHEAHVNSTCIWPIRPPSCVGGRASVVSVSLSALRLRGRIEEAADIACAYLMHVNANGPYQLCIRSTRSILL